MEVGYNNLKSTIVEFYVYITLGYSIVIQIRLIVPQQLNVARMFSNLLKPLTIANN
jgi:hypothetical protein